MTHLWLIYLLKNVIFHSYVSLPEGIPLADSQPIVASSKGLGIQSHQANDKCPRRIYFLRRSLAGFRPGFWLIKNHGKIMENDQNHGKSKSFNGLVFTGKLEPV